MAVVNKIFSKCNDVTSTIVFQYNDIFFTPSGVTFYDGECWFDTGVFSTLIPVADVTFDYYVDCDSCNTDNLVGMYLQNCSNPSIDMIASTKSTLVPTVGQIIYVYGQCWEYVSSANTNSNVIDTFAVYDDCASCLSLVPELITNYSATTFVNCCNSTDTITLYVNQANFVYPFGDTVVYNNKCYYSDLLTSGGTIIGYYEYPDYLGCAQCSEVIPCGTPTPTPSYTPTLTPTPTVTPSFTPSSTLTPTPTKTTGLPPTPSYTTTTTTRAVEQNQCNVITLLPLGVSCETTNPSSQDVADGSITLIITGGTAPYTGITWSNGVTGTASLFNLKAGTYSAVVVDYYGDFTAFTSCSIFAPTPTPTITPTPTLTPSSTPLPITGLCATFTVENYINYQYQFNYNTVINGRPSWTANTTNNPITISGGTLNMFYDNTLGQWTINGFSSTQWYPSSSSITSPPLANWVTNGNSPVNNVLVTSGTCPTYSPMVVVPLSNEASCASSADGSICISVYNGSGSFVYSIDGGSTTGTTNCFYNLGPGTYSVYVKDTVTSATTTQNVTIQNLNSNTVVNLTYTQTANTPLYTGQDVDTIESYLKSFSLNTEDIPNGTTLNLSFNLGQEFVSCEPGGGNNSGSEFVISKNGSPLTILPVSDTTTVSDRNNCFPSTCTTNTNVSTASCSLVNTDTLTIDIYNTVSISPVSNVQGCPTQLTNTMDVTTSLTYNATNCVSLVGSGLNVQSVTFVSAYDPNAPQ
jgi:hypothetical protein